MDSCIHEYKSTSSSITIDWKFMELKQKSSIDSKTKHSIYIFNV